MAKIGGEKKSKKKEKQFCDPPDIEFHDRLVVCNFSRVENENKHGFKKLSSTDCKHLTALIEKLKGLTWRHLRQGMFNYMEEMVGTKSYKMIEEVKPNLSLGKHYFHLRVKEGTKFRIFGYQHEGTFFVTHIDPKGKIHPKSHK